MKRLLGHGILGLGLLTPCVGCMSLPGSVNLLSESSAQPAGTKNSSLLPTKESSEICLRLGADMEANGFYGDAAVQYEKARALDPKLTGISRRLGVLYDLVGDERKALAEFDDAVKRNPKDADLLNDVGYCHYNRGRWKVAETNFRKALAVDPTHGRANINLGLALAQQGKFDEANHAFLKVNTPGEAKANIAFVLAAQGKRDDAMNLYRDALKAEPSLTSARNALAMLETGGKVNLVMGSPANKPELPSKPAGGMSCASGYCPNQEPPVDATSPVVIGPKRSTQAATASNWEVRPQ